MKRNDGRHDTWFRALLRLLPAEFRGDFGRQMAEDFRDQRQDVVRRRGILGLALLWLRLILPANGPVRVVGIVTDVVEWGLETKGVGIYLPHVQSFYVTPGSMVIRTDRDPQSLVPAIKAIVRRVNPEEPFPGVTSLEEEINLSTAPRRFILRMIGAFSLLGLILAVIGIYGVLAESVAERVPEIGIRKALGAQTSDVVALIMRQAAWIVSVGLGMGLLGAFLFRHEMTTMVFGVPTTDPISYVAGCAALLAATLSASAIPALRAATLDPVIALRTE